MLELDVINVWANRVVVDLVLPMEKRLTHPHEVFRFNFLSRDAPLLDSGLLGPVQLMSPEQ